MSLAHLAQNMAAHGRNGDTTLVHMNTREVADLQRMAEDKGTSLTTNPHTGLPEAFGLGDLNPVRILKGKGEIGESGLGSLVVGAALASMGIPPMYAGLMTGGATAVLTGDLQKGLFAGMGAYGGAGLMGGLAGLGETAVADQALNSSIDAQLSGVQQVGGPGLENSVQGFSPEAVGADPTQLGGPGMAETVVQPPSPIAADKIALPQTTTPAPGLDGVAQRLSSAGEGINQLTSKGGIDALSAQMTANGGPSLGMAAGAAGAGLLGGMTPKNPAADAKKLSPGYIRPFNYDPFGQRYTAQTPVPADQWGSRSFNAADGGIVALANGGAVQHYDAGGLTADQQAAAQAWVAANPTATREDALKTAVASGYTPEQANMAWSQYGAPSAPAAAAAAAPVATPAAAATPAVSATPAYTHYTDAQAENFFRTNPNVDIAEATRQFNADPALVNRYLAGLSAPYKDPTATESGSGTLGVIQNTRSLGIDPAEFSAAMQANDPNWGKEYWNKGTVSRAYEVADKVLAFDPQNDPVTPSDKEWVAFMDTNNFTVDDIARLTGAPISAVQARYDAAKTKPVVPVVKTPMPTNGISNTPSRPDVSVATPGDRRINEDKSVTVTPNIPGRPDDGFTGMTGVKDAYTTGGGSLGYAPYTPKTAAEHAQMFDTQTGGSRAAFDYLMGSGEYPTVPYTKTGEIMKPYSESVLGVPADNTRFAQRFNPATRKYEANPDYKPFNFNQDTGQTTRGMNAAELKAFVADPKNLEVPTVEAGKGFLGNLVQQLKDGLLDRPVWMAQNNISYEQLAASLGISVAEAKKRYPVNKAADVPAAAGSTTTVDSGGGGDGGAGDGGAGDGGAGDGGDGGDGGAGDGGDGSSAKRGGLMALAGGGLGTLGGYSDGGRLLKGPGDGVSDSIPASIGDKQPARLADGEFVVPARIVSELGNGSTDAGARKLYAMMDRVQKARGKTTGKGKVATNSRSDKYLPV